MFTREKLIELASEHRADPYRNPPSWYQVHLRVMAEQANFIFKAGIGIGVALTPFAVVLAAALLR